MNARSKQVVSGGIAVGVVAAVIAGVYAFGATLPAAEPTPTPTVSEVVVIDQTPRVDADQAEADAEAERARVAAEAARVAAEQATAAQAEAERIAAEQAARDAQNGGGQQNAPQAPSSPTRCPGGSSATESDGTNDTACMWVVCFSLTIPDAAHPECDSAFRP